MVRTLLLSTWSWLGRHSALVLLVVTVSGLAVGGLARLAGAGEVADAAWLAAAACGIVYSLWFTVGSLRRGRVGVDVIALLALAGAVAVREYLAAVVISVMLTSGRSLEAWADTRARLDLKALLTRAPRTAKRYRGGSLETVSLDEIAIGDVLLVAPGDVLAVDGSVAKGAAVLDESAITGEALPAERGPGDSVRSGTLNAGGPFDLRAQTSAADSTYAGIIRMVSEAEQSQAPFVAPDVRLTAADTALTRRFRTEHQAIRADIEQVRAAADALDAPGAMTRVRRVYDMLRREVWPHESAEETELYPSLNRVPGGTDPTAPMSRAHAEIAYQIARLGRLIDDIGTRAPGDTDIADPRAVLYGLHAILRHTVQEDETYLSLGNSADAVPR